MSALGGRRVVVNMNTDIGRLELIRGTLDQVDSTVDITWVQPRVLEGSQLEVLAQQIGSWSDSVGQTGKSVDQYQAAAAVTPLV
jgi:26S proteasome regulatory subunit N9